MGKVITQEINGIPLIRIILDDDDPRVCDYCNETLVVPEEHEVIEDDLSEYACKTCGVIFGALDGGTERSKQIAKSFAQEHIKITKRLKVLRECYATEYGLICAKCCPNIPILRHWKAGETYDNPY